MEWHYLRFFPLVIWALGFVFVVSLDSHWKQMDGRKDDTEKDEKAAAIVYLWGNVVFLIIGIFT